MISSLPITLVEVGVVYLIAGAGLRLLFRRWSSARFRRMCTVIDLPGLAKYGQSC
jgi:hypothetical protein